MDASHFLFLTFFDKRWHQWDRAEERLIRDLWVCWFGQVNDAGESWTKSTEAYLLLGSGWTEYCSVQIHHGESVRRGYSLSHEKAKAPKYNNASITGQPTCSYNMYGKNDLALQHFFFFLQDNCWDLILMLFLCSFVFSCKNLTVLECLYFIKCFNFFCYYTLELL